MKCAWMALASTNSNLPLSSLPRTNQAARKPAETQAAVHPHRAKAATHRRRPTPRLKCKSMATVRLSSKSAPPTTTSGRHHRPAARPQSRHQTFVNGTAMSPVQIDTSIAATDTIAYVVTDQSGLTATSTRTVIIEPAANSPLEPAATPPSDDDARSTATTPAATLPLNNPSPTGDSSVMLPRAASQTFRSPECYSQQCHCHR